MPRRSSLIYHDHPQWLANDHRRTKKGAVAYLQGQVRAGKGKRYCYNYPMATAFRDKISHKHNINKRFSDERKTLRQTTLEFPFEGYACKDVL